MPSPLGEGQADTPINRLNLGEVPSRTLPNNSCNRNQRRICCSQIDSTPSANETEPRTAEKNTGLVQPSGFALFRCYFPIIRKRNLHNTSLTARLLAVTLACISKTES